MKTFRESIILKIFWVVFAFHILNCSVDCPDPQPSNVAEDLSYNDMESIVEILLEEGIGIINAIPEYDDDDHDNDNDNANGVAFTLKKDIIINYQIPDTVVFNAIEASSDVKYLAYKEIYFQQYHPDLIPKPPKS